MDSEQVTIPRAEHRLYVWTLAFCLLFLSAFVAEHIVLTLDAVRHPAQLIEACPARKS